MNAIELLKQQHREVEDLIEKIEKGNGKDRETLFEELADCVAMHASIEEKLFYPAAYKDQTEELLREAVEEHLSVKRVLTDIMEVGVEDETFEAKLSVLKEQIEHHVQEEEKELFKKVRKVLSKEELETLGADMEVLSNELLETEPRLEVPGETDAPAPLE